MSRVLDRLQPSNAPGLPRGVYTNQQRVCEQVEAIVTDLQDQITALENLNSDNVLTPAKKPVWILFHAFLTSEQAGLDAQATTLGITTEKTTYDSSITALNAHLATLTATVAWNNLTGDTTIVGTTFRGKFNDVLVAKQALINAMTAASGGDAAAALAAANAAQATANTAQSTANTAQTTAQTVQRDDAISDSVIIPGTVLSAADAGASATITVANHTRQYNDGVSRSITGANITGLAYSTKYYVYYDNTGRTAGAQTYVATTSAATSLPGAAAGRHHCGDITTPAAAGAATTGGYNPPGGGGGVIRGEVV